MVTFFFCFRVCASTSTVWSKLSMKLDCWVCPYSCFFFSLHCVCVCLCNRNSVRLTQWLVEKRIYTYTFNFYDYIHYSHWIYEFHMEIRGLFWIWIIIECWFRLNDGLPMLTVICPLSNVLISRLFGSNASQKTK